MSFPPQNNYSRAPIRQSYFPINNHYRNAPSHNSKPSTNSSDRGNTFSRFPLKQRSYNHQAPKGNKFADRPPATFTTLKEFNFYEDEKTQMRATIMNINAETFVGINKMWRLPDQQEWLFSKKSLFMPAHMFQSFAKMVPKIESELEQLEAEHDSETTFPHGMSDHAAALRKSLDSRTTIPMKFNVTNNNVTRVPVAKRPYPFAAKPALKLVLEEPDESRPAASKPIPLSTYARWQQNMKKAQEEAAKTLTQAEIDEVKEMVDYSESPQSPQPLVIVENVEPVKSSKLAKKPKLIPIVKQEEVDDDPIH